MLLGHRAFGAVPSLVRQCRLLPAQRGPRSPQQAANRPARAGPPDCPCTRATGQRRLRFPAPVLGVGVPRQTRPVQLADPRRSSRRPFELPSSPSEQRASCFGAAPNGRPSRTCVRTLSTSNCRSLPCLLSRLVAANELRYAPDATCATTRTSTSEACDGGRDSIRILSAHLQSNVRSS